MCVAAGMAVMAAMIGAEIARACGPKAQQRPGCVAIASAAQPSAAGLRQGTLAMSYSSRASMALLASWAWATCCAV